MNRYIVVWADRQSGGVGRLHETFTNADAAQYAARNLATHNVFTTVVGLRYD